MKVILAQPRGFCAGVVRAVDIVERAVRKYGSPVYVRHEIVHNARVVEGLKAKGARFVEDLADVPPGARTIFSAHGVSHAVEREAADRGLPVVDATCPLVARVHAQAQRYVEQGRALVLIGHAGHPEIDGTIGRIDGPVHLVKSPEDVEALDLPSDTPVGYVTQTTLSLDDARGVIAALADRFADLAGSDTKDICYATQNRQNAVLELSKHVDLILVVGARNSSNSNRLRELGAQAVPSYLVADASELDVERLRGVETIGVTAGASAPDELVQEIIESLRALGPLELSTLPGVREEIEFKLPAELLDA
jgi:4-hydroxy-3-methylbut-2-enyl diphosphate reductase